MSDLFMANQEPAIREYIKQILNVTKLDIEDIWWGDDWKHIAVRNGLIVGLGKFKLPLSQISEIVKRDKDYTREVLELARKYPSIHERVNTFRWVA